jgi:hypothetical protein
MSIVHSSVASVSPSCWTRLIDFFYFMSFLMRLVLLLRNFFLGAVHYITFINWLYLICLVFD